MVRRSSSILLLLFSLAVTFPVSAQVNPFADGEEEENEEAKKKAAAKKKAEEAKKEAAAKKKKAAEAKKKKEAEAKKKSAEEKKKKEAEAKKKAEEEASRAAAEAEAEEAEEADEESGEAEEEEEGEEEAASVLPEEEEEEVEDEDEEVVEVRPRGRVGLRENFGQAELITAAVVLPLGLGLAIGGPSLFGEPSASMTSPRLGSIDYRLSVASHGDLREGNPFTFGIFDIAGVAYPALLGGYYLVSGLYLWAADEPMLGSQSFNVDHKMIAMAETVGWTALTTGAIHLLVGRQKPYAAFRRSAYGASSDKGTNLSFISTTAALSFAMSSFAARDYADWALRNDQNFVTGAILPYTVLYGLSAMIGYSAIFGQQHYFSDIAISALIGALIGNLSYVAHFDREGNARAQRRPETAWGPTLLRSPADEATTLGVGLSGRF